MKYFYLKLLLIMLLYLPILTNFDLKAATQGSLDTTSSGNLSINLSLDNRVRITGMADANFGEWDGSSGNKARVDDICVYAKTATANYDVTVTGDGPGSSFQVTNGNGDYINYRVYWNDVAGTNSGQTLLTSTVKLENQTGANTQSDFCGSGSSNTARIRVLFLYADLSNANVGGTYTGSITVLIGTQ